MMFQCFDAVGWEAGSAAGLQKKQVVRCCTGIVICLQREANDLHTVQLMPLPCHHLLLQ